MKHWIPLPTTYLDTRQIQALPDAVFKTLINLRCLAGQLDRGGLIPSREDCVFRLRMSIKKFTHAVDRLLDDGLLVATPDGLMLSDWDGYGERKSQAHQEQQHRAKSNADRQREYRARHRVTDGVTSVTESVTEDVTSVTESVTDGVTEVTPYNTEHHNTKNITKHHHNTPQNITTHPVTARYGVTDEDHPSLRSDADDLPTDLPRPDLPRRSSFRSIGEATAQMLETVRQRSEAIRQARERRGGGEEEVFEKPEKRGGGEKSSQQEKQEAPSPCSQPSPKTAQEVQEAASLVFPPCLSDQQAKGLALALLEPCEGASQSLLDELAARAQQTEIKSPISYLRGLVNRYKSGEFVPEASVQVAAKREKARAMSRLAAEDDASGDCMAYQAIRAEAKKLGIPINHINPRMMTPEELNLEMDILIHAVREARQPISV